MANKSLFPCPPDWSIPWDAWEDTALGSCFSAMADTPQDPAYHGEGDVWTHTRLVCQALTDLPGFRALPERRRQALFLAALLHDLGKVPCTRWEDGRPVSTHHASVGASWVRQQLWPQLSGPGMAFRETVCCLIRYHTLPVHAISRGDGARALCRAAANGTVLPDFQLEMLCLLAEADILGRVCQDQKELLERVALCRELAREAGCFSGPRAFPSQHTAFRYYSGKTDFPDVPQYDDTWGTVTLLSGLPGTGKDTWIGENCPELPVVSLDALRAQLKIAPTEPQAKVAEAAREQARRYLREKREFVWNATNLSPQLRGRVTSLCGNYGAAVRIIYLETDWQTLLRRNAARRAMVPEGEIRRMLEKLVPPEPWEARRVEWKVV